MSTAPSFGSAVSSVTKRHVRVGLNSYHRVPFHDQTWTPMRENIFWKKSLLIAGLTCPQTNLPHLRRKTVMRSISQLYHLNRKNRISGLDGVQQVPRTVSVSDRPCNLQNTPVVLKIAVSSHPSKSSNCTFCQAVWELMVEETNRYAAQTWTPTNVPKMMAFVALLLTMGINKIPRYSMHWSTSDVLRSPLYSSTMARNRFTAILRFLHLANNQAEDKFPPDKLFKVRPLLDIVLPSFLRIYKPGRNLSPDETMVKFNGRIGFKQYTPQKAAKWGLKYFSLNESETGYTCAWKLFTGSQPMPPPRETTIAYAATHHPPNLPAQGKVVLDLLKGLEHKGHCINMDNWFNSPALVSKLSQLGFGACGTVRYTTRGIPAFANPKKHPMKRDADPQFYQKAGQLHVCVVWQDTKRVTLLTNYGDCSVTTKQIRSKKSSTGYREIQKPSIVNDQNKYMGGCDLAGQLCKYYTHNHRTLKWWKRLFVTILDICLLNATIAYNSIPTNSRLSGLEFRVKVIEGLLSTWKYNPAQHANQLSCSRPSSQHPHFPGRSGKKRNCVVCSTKFKRRQTRMICKHCNKPMCVVPCFEKFHSQ